MPAELARLDAEMDDWLTRHRRELALLCAALAVGVAAWLIPVWVPLLRALAA